MKALAGAVAVLVSVAGCAQTSTQSGGSPAPSGLGFAPDAQGLAVTGTTQRIDFGRAPDGVVIVLDRETGPHRALGLSACPAHVTQQLAWDGLVLTFTDERFVGWKQGGAQAGAVCAG